MEAAESLRRRCSESSHPSTVTLMAANVLYDAATVPLLISTVATMAAGCLKAADAAASLTWWLAYTPRSLTRAGNEHIFQTLVDAVVQHGWAYDVFPLPAGAVTTGFEGCGDCNTPALRGCILVVRVTASPASSFFFSSAGSGTSGAKP